MCVRAEAAPPVSLLIAPGRVNARIPPRASAHASFLSSPHPKAEQPSSLLPHTRPKGLLSLGEGCEDATASALIPWTTLSSPSPTGQVMALQQPLPSVPSCSLSMWFLHLFSFACPLPQCLSHRRRVSRHSFDDCISPFPHGAPELYGWNGLFPGPQSLPFRPTRRDLPYSKCPGLLFVFLCCGLTYCQPILLGRATLGYL